MELTHLFFLKLSAVLQLLLIFQNAAAENILAYGIVGSYSQRISMWPLLEALAEKGHNVTYISAYEIKDPHPKIRDYAPKLWRERMGPWEEHMSFYDIRKAGKMVNMWFRLLDVGVLACESLMEDEEFIGWVKSSHFDLIIMDTLMNECALSLVHYWKAKLIVYSTTNAMGWFSDQHGIPDESSSVTDMMYNFPRGKDMTFWQRFVNALTPLAWKFHREFWFLPTLEELCKKGLGLKEIPKFTEIEKNASFVMITTHFTLEGPKSLPSNGIFVQGVAVGIDQKKLKPIDQKMKEFIEKGKDGFVYISFGTVAEFANFDKEVQVEFIRAVEKFKDLRFVWKSSLPINMTLPGNVMVTTWAPQTSLLAHPKIKAFISHTGMGSTTEAIHFSVPVISLPVLAEQDMNGQGIASKGAGIKLEITTLKQHELEDALREVVYNPKYKKAMERLTKMFNDRPMTPVQESLWWTEYVLRYDNPHEFLTHPSVHQPWWVKRQIDVWLVATGIVLILISFMIFIAYVICKKIVQFLFRKFTSSAEKVKQN